VPGQLIATSYRGKGNGGLLTADISGPGGVALLWGGTAVLAGGPTQLASSLHRVWIDGRAVPTHCARRSFTTPATRLTGCLVSVRVASGTHTLTLG
ncbi:MAG: hypothetical protein ACYDB7_10560, partial [Mycobacteriales bacterium]